MPTQKAIRCLTAVLCCSLLITGTVSAQDEKKKIELEFYANIWLATSYNFQSSDPNWPEMLRPTKILNDQGQPFSVNGEYNISVRPSRFGFHGYYPTSKGKIHTQFDFDLVGGGSNAGQTTFRLFNAYAEWNRWTFGQRNSLFMDGSVVPNTVDFFGPNGMVLLRNVQISYKPILTEKHELAVGLENPNATSDLGQYGEDYDYQARLEDIKFRVILPAFTAHYRRTFDKGHYQVGLVAKHVAWADLGATPQEDYSGEDWGFGTNLSGSVFVAPKIRLLGSFTTGKGIQNFINDGTADIGTQRNFGNSFKPITGKAIPFYAFMVYTEIEWRNPRWRSAFGYSMLHNNTFETQLNTAFETGQYATACIMYSPAEKINFGLEYQYARRDNAEFIGDPASGLPPAAGNSFSINKIQFMATLKFSSKQ